MSTLCLTALSTSLCGVQPVSAASKATELGPLETKFFAHQYEKEAPADRLNRLETLVFGKAQTGSIEDRVAKLTAAVPVTAVAQNQSSNNGVKSQSSKPESPAKAGSKPADDTYNYPKVTELEQSILGKTYKGESVRNRLSRLESKAYGAPSNSDDLASRVDKLSNYSRTYGMQSDDQYFSSAGSAAGSSAPQQGASGMLERVSAMENKVFGRASTGQALTHRIKNLETSVYGKAGGSSNDDMSARVNRLWAAVKVDSLSSVASAQSSFGTQGNSKSTRASQPFNSQGYNQSPIAMNNPYAGSYASNGSIGNYSASGGNPYTANDPYAPSNPYGMKNPYSGSANKHQKHKHKNKSSHGGSFLGTLGKVVVGAGSVAVGAGALAVSAVGSSGGGYYGGGYGTGFGVPYRSYGGYGLNSFGSPYASSYAGSFFSR